MQDDQINCAALASDDIEVYNNRVNTTAVASRPSYLNAVLIQSRGATAQCFDCRRNPTRGPFVYCRTTDFFGGCCGNCKYRDHGARCRVEDDDSDSSYEDDSYSTEDEPEESDASTDEVSDGETEAEEDKKKEEGEEEEEEEDEEMED